MYRSVLCLGATSLFLLLSIAGCSQPRAVPGGTMPAPEGASVPATDAAPHAAEIGAAVTDGPAEPVRPSLPDGCVVLTGESKKSARTTRLPGGVAGPGRASSACSLEVECDGARGQGKRRGSHLAFTCAGRSCTCVVETPAPTKKTTRLKVDVDSACGSTERAKELLAEHCLPILKGSH